MPMASKIAATRFIPSASLANAPEDILVQILAFVSVLDVLSIRRCCRRLYHITNSRIIWIDALRKIYSRRFLPQLNPPAVTSRLSNSFLEHRATRPLRFLHALADIASAKYRLSTIDLEEEIAHPALEEDARWRSGVLGFQLVPGGRWLCLVLNRRSINEPVNRAVLIIYDLWREHAVARHAFVRSAHYTHVQLDDSGSSIIVVIGFDKTRTSDPYFTAYRVGLPQLESSEPRIDRLGGLKVERTPRSCSTFENTLAFADRIGHVTFWDWKEQTSASMLIGGWPPSKGKIMMMSEEYFATFNPASSAFAIHRVPTLLPCAAAPGPDNAMPAGFVYDPTNEVQPIAPVPVTPPVAMQPALPTIPQPNGPSLGIKRFRLPSRNLQVTLPAKVPASAFYPNNASFPDPFLAYFVAVHPENLSELYLGVIPEIESDDDIDDLLDDDNDDLDGDEDSAQDSEESQPTQPVNPPEPFQAAIPPQPLAPGPLFAAANHIMALGPPPAQPPPGVPQGPEPEWLHTLRCVDTSTHERFTTNGKILFCGAIDQSIAVLRSNSQNMLEIFTTTALHSKPEVTPPPRPARQAPPVETGLMRQVAYHNVFRGAGDPSMGLYLAPAFLHQMVGHLAPFGLGRLFPPAPGSLDVAHAIGGGTGGGGGDPGPSTLRARTDAVSANGSRKRPRRGSSPQQDSEPEPAHQPAPVPEPPVANYSYKPPPNPHARSGPYAEGDYQVLQYRTIGDVWAATVDDVSGKICLVVENYDHVQVIVLDYGWDFWKEDANEEQDWRRAAAAASAADDGSDDGSEADRARTLSRGFAV